MIVLFFLIVVQKAYSVGLGDERRKLETTREKSLSMAFSPFGSFSG
jgi:hypothetical protein